MVPPNQLKRLVDQGTIPVDEPVEITGVLQSDPEAAPERLYLNLQVEVIRVREPKEKLRV